MQTNIHCTARNYWACMVQWWGECAPLMVIIVTGCCKSSYPAPRLSQREEIKINWQALETALTCQTSHPLHVSIPWICPGSILLTDIVNFMSNSNVNCTLLMSAPMSTFQVSHCSWPWHASYLMSILWFNGSALYKMKVLVISSNQLFVTCVGQVTNFSSFDVSREQVNYVLNIEVSPEGRKESGNSTNCE